MDGEKLFDDYINKLNEEILPNIDYGRLQESYATSDKDYAKTVLKQMHDAFVEVYGTDYLDNGDFDPDDAFVTVPAIIKGRNTGEICIGLVDIDLSSSGEHYGTDFLTKYGVMRQGEKDASPEASDFISENYMPYNYWYTVGVERDHHVNFDEIPDDVNALYEICQNDQQDNGMQMD